VIYVEILDRRGEVLRRERVTALPARIGRGYDNEIILDDPHVCATHALLEDVGWGPLRLRNLDSLNGVLELPSGRRANVVDMMPGTVAQLGRTLVRIRDAAEPVPAAVPISRRPHVVEWSLGHWTASIAWIALMLGAGTWSATRAATADVNWNSIALAQGGSLLAVLAWAGAWALVTRLMTHHARFGAHLAIAVIAVIASDLQTRAFEVAQFLLAPVEPLQLANRSLTALIVAAAIFAHLTVLGVARTVRRLAAAAGIGAAVLALGLGNELSDEPDWMVTLPYWSSLEPFPGRWLPVESEDRFFGEVAALEPELQSLQGDAPVEERGAD
jgi:hypothetical protein